MDWVGWYICLSSPTTDSYTHYYYYSNRTSGSGQGKIGMTKKNSKMKGGLGGMVSAMIPGAKVDNKGRVMVNVGFDKDTLIINIGGMVFETYR